jgi:hypothetical protein
MSFAMGPRFRKAVVPLKHAHEGIRLRIVGDGAIASVGIGDGRLIPLVILDTSERPDLEEFISLHQATPSGAVSAQWAQLVDRRKDVAIILRFLVPAEVTAIVNFDLDVGQGVLVEQILRARALYVQPGRAGDRLRHDMDKPKVLIEIPDMGFRSYWDGAYMDFARRRARASGLDRNASMRAAKAFVDQMRELAELRIKGEY